MRTGPVTGGRPLPGAAVAAVTAAVSGVSVFVNAYGVHAIATPSVYTTAKNLVAALCIAAVGAAAAAVRRGRRRPGAGAAPAPPPRRGAAWWLGLAYVGVVGGGLAFVLFFDGLADTTAAPAAFCHDTLVVWVALAAWPLLGERAGRWNVAAVGLVVVGEVVVSGGVGHLALGRGELLVLASSVLWALEVVVAKVLLRGVRPLHVALVRMGGGAVTLVGYLAATGALHALASLDARQVGWALLTGLLLAAYVGSWMVALSRARALDVTSVLVGGAVVTWVLQVAAGTAPVGGPALGLLLVGAGTLVALQAARRAGPVAGATAGSRSVAP